MKKRMLSSLTVMFSTLLLTACGTQQSHITVPAISDIKKVTVSGGLPGSPWATLTKSQDSNVLSMLKKAQYKGTDTPTKDGYPPVLEIEMPNGHTVTISPAVELKKQGNSETGVGLKDYVDFYDSNDKSNKLHRLYTPDLYDFLSNWQQAIPKSQWQTNG